MVSPTPSGTITHRVINECHKCSSFASKDGGQISAAFRTAASVMRGGYRWGPVDLPTQERRGRGGILMIFALHGFQSECARVSDVHTCAQHGYDFYNHK